MRVFSYSWREVTITESIFNTYDEDKLCSCLSETRRKHVRAGTRTTPHVVGVCYCIGKQGARLISRSMEFANLVLFLATNLPPTKMWNGMCCFLTQTMLFLFHMPHILKNHLDVSNVRMINETRLGRLVTERIKRDAQNDMYNSYMWSITMKITEGREDDVFLHASTLTR